MYSHAFARHATSITSFNRVSRNIMNRRQLIANVLFSLGASCASGSVWAQSALSPATVDVAGYKFPTTTQVGGQQVELNGTGIRKIAFFNIYAMGLYLPHKTKSATEALQMAGNKHMTLFMMHGVPMPLFIKLMVNGIRQGASPQELNKLNPDIERLEGLFANEPPAEVGDKLVIEWVNGTGMTVNFRGQTLGTPFTNPEFFRVVLNVWLGDDPISNNLKRGLLGGA